MPLRYQAVTWYFQLPHKHGSEQAFNKSTPSSTLLTPKSIWKKKDKEEGLKKKSKTKSFWSGLRQMKAKNHFWKVPANSPR